MAEWTGAAGFAAALALIALRVPVAVAMGLVGAGGARALAAARGRLRLGRLRDGLLETAQTTGMIFLILVGAAWFNFFVETSGLPRAAVGWVAEAGLTPFGALLAIMALYLVLGCFLDSLSMILLTLPTVFPLVEALGLHPIWFGVLLISVVEIGLITPPVGMNLFVIRAVSPETPLAAIWRGATPFVLADLLRLGLLIAAPALSLALPRALGLA